MKKLLTAALLASACLTGPAYAGPFIIDGTDADDHGFESGGVNFDGWLYIQKGLENIAAGSGLTRTQKTIAVLGSDAGGQSASAINAAVNNSATLSGAGWTVVLLNDAEINDFFNNTGSGLFSTAASVIYMGSGSNVGGGHSFAEQGIVDGFATEINNFVGSGGGLFTHSQGYGWLSTLIPGLTTFDEFDTGIGLTAAGSAAFPGLSDSDLSAGPYHNGFNNTGAVPILARSTQTDSIILIGGAGGSITDPDPIPGIPEPATWAMMIIGFGAIGSAMRRRPRHATVRVTYA